MGKWNYPETRKTDYCEVYHGETVADPYAWLERGRDEEVLNWVRREHECTDRFFAGFGNELEEKMDELRREKRKPSYGSFSMSGEYFAALKRDGSGQESFVLLDESFAERETIMAAADFDPAAHVYGIDLNPSDSHMAAFEVLYPGADRPASVVCRWDTKEILYRLDGIFSHAWNKKGDILYYADAWIDREKQVAHNRVCSLNIETGQKQVLYEYPEPSVLIMLTLSDTGEELFAQVWVDYHDKELVCIAAESGEFHLYRHREPADCHYIGTEGDRHYFLTDEAAPYGKIIAVKKSEYSMEEAQVILPESSRILKTAAVAAGKLAVVSLEDVNAVLCLYDAAGRFLGRPETPCRYGDFGASSMGKMGSIWREKKRIYLNYQSFTVPPSVVYLDMEKENLVTVYREADETIDDIEVEQKFVTAPDGSRAAAYLVYPKGTKFSRDTRTLMYGYGGYNVCELPSYQCYYYGDIARWVRQGNLYVLCTIRGGGEYGSRWHEAGYRMNKTKGYDDFIAITEMLIREGYTNPSRIALIGGSNGGLLVTALMTRRPDLYQAVIASVPHTDMLHFARDDRGAMYMTEYGDPSDEAMYHYLRSYSPYHNVREGVHYPAVYIQTGENDNNVPPYHGKKMAARLQECQGGDLPILLRVLPHGSHDTGTGEDHYRTMAERRIFLDWALSQEGK